MSGKRGRPRGSGKRQLEAAAEVARQAAEMAKKVPVALASDDIDLDAGSSVSGAVSPGEIVAVPAVVVPVIPEVSEKPARKRRVVPKEVVAVISDGVSQASGGQFSWLMRMR